MPESDTSGSKPAKPAKPGRLVKKKAVLIDESIQGTNDSSIVSKRSVEKLYWNSQGTQHANGKGVEFFRHFVKKFQRRSPIINRGYWTRMEAMKSIISKFVKSDFSGTKVVVNLGCGYDPYPFQYLASRDKLENVVFLDVDYTALINNKVKIVMSAENLKQIIGSALGGKAHESVLLRTESYVAAGCDLRKLEEFTALLSSLFDLESTAFLFTAEVSLTYMTQVSADALIQWAAHLPRSEFALLEQIMPSGPQHPFASTMLRHFTDLKTPLNSIAKYPTIRHQRNRFLSRNWKSVQVQDLYGFWKNEIAETDKHKVDAVEDFDEWEEFILFCQHYFILHASNWADKASSTWGHKLRPSRVGHRISIQPVESPAMRRKFSAGALLDQSSVLIQGGLTTSREQVSIVATTASGVPQQAKFPSTGRMCHSMVKLTGGDILLVGGRRSPSQPLDDCWLLSGGIWTQVASLPHPRYRHSAVSVGNNEALIFGGCTTDEQSPWLMWTREGTWRYLSDSVVASRFSSALSWDSSRGVGVLVGGMSSGHIHEDAYELKLNPIRNEITAECMTVSPLLSRYGANSTFLDEKTLLIAGGVSSHKLLDESDTFISLNLVSADVSSVPVDSALLPLLVGSNLDVVDDHLVIYGGGCVCFSFGPTWVDLLVAKVGEECNKLTFKISEPIAAPADKSRNFLTSIPVGGVTGLFPTVYRTGHPHIFRGVDLGTCVSKWTDPQYLIDTIGADTKVVVHVSDASNLNFQAKNFEYKNMGFADFTKKMFAKNSSVYLRALSSDKPRDLPAVFRTDFPMLSEDFCLPPYFADIEKQQFSSPLRMSSANTSMWLHYDVTANILCQIVGRKVVRLYPPEDVVHLSFPAGSSSSTIENIFETDISGVHPVEVVMDPGDVLFIPAMWLHATRPETSSISLNFFWKDLDPVKYAAGKDVYGNRDLQPYETGRAALTKLASNFEGLRDDIRRFYLLRLAAELEAMAN